MAFKVDKKGNITLIQGDNGSLAIDGIKTDKNYKVYLAIQDKNRNPIGQELCVQTNQNPSVVFELTADYTGLMTVKKDESVGVYFYGVKLCSDEGLEDTLLLGDSEIGEVNTITVYPRKVEGVING